MSIEVTVRKVIVDAEGLYEILLKLSPDELDSGKMLWIYSADNYSLKDKSWYWDGTLPEPYLVPMMFNTETRENKELDDDIRTQILADKIVEEFERYESIR